ncbi:Hypothetical protein FKW44_011866 [Caligus rogercresseyi]|uniref:Uncharacterized protein n=1 Tax=Caligus rogercresseyi TaxID=217165 RepID=A0A7T8HJ61_CALRO|nr:Hypothetical protein FKW44_011866 [Caligus rogercresseyi]
MSVDWITTLDIKDKKKLNLPALSLCLHKTNLMSSLTEADRFKSVSSHAQALKDWQHGFTWIGPVIHNQRNLTRQDRDFIDTLHLIIKFPAFHLHTIRQRGLLGSILRAISRLPFKSLTNG